MKILKTLIISVLLLGCQANNDVEVLQPENNKELSETTDNDDNLMVMLKLNIEVPISEYRTTNNVNILGYWCATKYYVKNQDDEHWHHVKYANHNKAFEFFEDNSYSEKKIYFESKLNTEVSGNFFLVNKDSITTLKIAPFEPGRTSFDIGDTMLTAYNDLTWINDTTIYLEHISPITKSHFLLELTKSER